MTLLSVVVRLALGVLLTASGNQHDAVFVDEGNGDCSGSRNLIWVVSLGSPPFSP